MLNTMPSRGKIVDPSFIKLRYTISTGPKKVFPKTKKGVSSKFELI